MTARPAPAGPLETEAEARALARRTVPGADRRAPHAVNRELLAAACRDTGLTPGAYEARILAWLAGWEPSTVTVVAALIRRAYLAGCTAPGPARPGAPRRTRARTAPARRGRTPGAA